MFVYVSKVHPDTGEPMSTYVYGDHEGDHKKARVPYGLKLETIGDKPYDACWKLKGVPQEYWGAYDHTNYPDWWIAAADVSLSPVLPVPPTPTPQPTPQPQPPSTSYSLPKVSMEIVLNLGDFQNLTFEQIEKLIKLVKE